MGMLVFYSYIACSFQIKGQIVTLYPDSGCERLFSVDFFQHLDSDMI